MNSNLSFKRVLAYIIDFLVITVISSALTEITFINPKYDEYKKASDEYTMIAEKYYIKRSNNTTELKEKTKKIEEKVKEYKENSTDENILKASESFLDYLINFDFEKNEIDELKTKVEEYKSIVKSEEKTDLEKDLEEYITYINEYKNNNTITSELQEKMPDLSYRLLKYGYVYIIGDIVIALLYFGVFNYVTKGQTLGKKVMRIRIVSNEGKDVKLYQYVIRAIILNGIILNVVSLVAICFNKTTFNTIYRYGSNFDTVLMLTNFLMIMFMKNGRGLHDILAGTKVIDLKNTSEEVIKEPKKEVEEVEKEEVKPTTAKKTTSSKKKNTTKRTAKKDE